MKTTRSKPWLKPSLWLSLLTATAASAATLNSGYVIGGFGPNVFIDNAATGGGDSTQVATGDLGWVVQMTNLWNVGQTIRITGVALPIRTTTTAGTFTFNFYGQDQGANTNSFEGVGTETLLGSAQATLAADAAASAYSVTFDTPVVFTAASRGIAIQFTNSGGNLRVKINTAAVAPNAARLVSATGAQDTSGTANNTNMRFTLAGSVVVPPAVGSLLWQGNLSADWDGTTTNWNRHLGGYAFAPDKYTDNGSFGPQVIFDDTLVAPFRTNINLTTGTLLRPSSLIFANGAYRYAFSGPGKITGATVLTNKGPGVVTLSTASDFTGGSMLGGGRIRLGNANALGSGTIAFASGAMSSVGAASLSITNTLLVTGAAVLGSTTDNGVINLPGVVDFNGGNGTIDAQSDVVLSGVLTNANLRTKSGPGTLTLKGVDSEYGGWTVQRGTLVIDGINVAKTNGSLAVGAAQANGVASLVITNGAVVTLQSQSAFYGGMQIGIQGISTATSSNYLYLAGTLGYQSNVSGLLLMGQASAYDEFDMFPGSRLRVCAIPHATAGGSTVVNINGGTIAAAASTNDFMSGHTAVNIQAGGLIFDTENYTNTISQPLLSGGGSGGLTKQGTGTLWLTGSSTYTGATVVQAGLLGLYPGFAPNNVLTASAVVVSNGASLATDFVPVPGASVELTSLALNGSGVNVNYGDLFGTAASTVAFQGPSASGIPLSVSGVNTIRLIAQNFGIGQYPIIQFSVRTGSGSFVASLPPGVVGTVATNGNQIVVNITAAPKSLTWYGSTDSATLNQNWNTTSLNWNYAAAKYSENLGVGDFVTFDDSVFTFFDGVNSIPATKVNLTQPLAPLTMTVNSFYGYTFSSTGSGKITGSTALLKSGTGSLKLLTANDHTGGSKLAGGAVMIGNNTALGRGPVTLGGASLSSDSGTARMVTNSLLLNANAALGDAVNSGPLTLSGPTDLGGGARDLGIASPVVFSGSMTNGGLDEKTGAATLTFSGVTGTATTGNWQVEDGAFVISGGSLAKSGGGVRIGSTIPSGIARLVVTNGAVVNFTAAGLNIRLGNDQAPAADATSTNILDVAGTVAWVTNASGAVFIGSAGSLAQLNLLSGGLLKVNFFSAGANSSELNLNGGTLSPTTNRADYLQGLTRATVWPGGVTFDTSGFDIGVAQPLLNGGGGLTKTGNGTLSLNGVNTYTGPTIVSGGALGGTGVISGPVTIGASGALSPGNSIGTLTISDNLTLGGNVLIEVNKSAAPSHDSVAVTGTLTYGGTITVANLGPSLSIGDSFPVFPAGGTGTVTVVGDAGPGQAFSLDKATGVISVVASLPTPTPLNYTPIAPGVLQFSWTGAFKLQWQTNAAAVGLSANWVDYPNTSNPVNVTNNPAVPTTFFRLKNL